MYVGLTTNDATTTTTVELLSSLALTGSIILQQLTDCIYVWKGHTLEKDQNIFKFVRFEKFLVVAQVASCVTLYIHTDKTNRDNLEFCGVSHPF